MRLCEVTGWMAGLLSADGHVTKKRPPTVQIASSSEPEWLKLIARTIDETTDLDVKIFGPYTHNNGFVSATPTWRLYEILVPVRELIIPRKWKLLEDYFVPYLDKHRLRLEAYHEVRSRIRKGEVRSRACTVVAQEYGVPENTVQFWVYNNQKPRLWRKGEVNPTL